MKYKYINALNKMVGKLFKDPCNINDYIYNKKCKMLLIQAENTEAPQQPYLQYPDIQV